jgi:hypothetical protein
MKSFEKKAESNGIVFALISLLRLKEFSAVLIIFTHSIWRTKDV